MHGEEVSVQGLLLSSWIIQSFWDTNARCVCAHVFCMFLFEHQAGACVCAFVFAYVEVNTNTCKCHKAACAWAVLFPPTSSSRFTCCDVCVSVCVSSRCSWKLPLLTVGSLHHLHHLRARVHTHCDLAVYCGISHLEVSQTFVPHFSRRYSRCTCLTELLVQPGQTDKLIQSMNLLFIWQDLAVAPTCRWL